MKFHRDRYRCEISITSSMALILFMLLALPNERSFAQNVSYPTRMVRIILPFPAGSAPDVSLRMLSEQLSAKWGKPVIVDNKPGASSIIGTMAVVKAQPNGYTILATVSLLAQNYSLRKDLPYDTFRDLIPVTEIQREQLVLYVRGDSPVHDIAGLIALAKARPGEIKFGTWGAGSTGHLTLETLRRETGVDMLHVPYRGTPEIATAVVSGIVDVGVGDLLSPSSLIQSGQLRAIAVTGPSRVPTMPDVETFSEGGLNGFDKFNWVGLFAPAGTAPEIIRKVSETINQIQADPIYEKRVKERLLVLPSVTTPEQFSAMFKQDVSRWAAIISATGVTVP
jgi:tripartite-type tricarboxylate transporter receptor subunit TctC